MVFSFSIILGCDFSILFEFEFLLIGEVLWRARPSFITVRLSCIFPLVAVKLIIHVIFEVDTFLVHCRLVLNLTLILGSMTEVLLLVMLIKWVILILRIKIKCIYFFLSEVSACCRTNV